MQVLFVVMGQATFSSRYGRRATMLHLQTSPDVYRPCR